MHKWARREDKCKIIVRNATKGRRKHYTAWPQVLSSTLSLKWQGPQTLGYRQELANLQPAYGCMGVALYTEWVYKMKTAAIRDIERLKAQLAACGTEQGFEVDYVLTFAAVMDMLTVTIIFALAAMWGVVTEHGKMNTYVKADKEADLEILLEVPRGWL